jgi:hypothetical protein
VEEKIVGFQEVRKRALELVAELGPSFEELEKEKSQEEDEIKSETKEKGKKQELLEAAKEPRT